MKQRAAKKKQTKKVKAAKRKQKEARKRAAAAGEGGGGDGGDKDGDVAMDAEVAAADEAVAAAEAEAQAKPAGRAAHALKVQARRALKTKLEGLKGARQKIAKKNVHLKPERKAISRRIKGLLAGDDAELAAVARDLPDDDDEWEEYDAGDGDVEMAA